MCSLYGFLNKWHSHFLALILWLLCDFFIHTALWYYHDLFLNKIFLWGLSYNWISRKAILRKIVHRAQSELYGRQQGENFTNKITGVKRLKSPLPSWCFLFLMFKHFWQDEDNELEETGLECVICMSDMRDTLILPCRHLCLCRDCGRLMFVAFHDFIFRRFTMLRLSVEWI